MAESYLEKRKRELGLTGGSSDGVSFVQRRQMDLGMIPDTRKVENKPVSELKKSVPDKLKTLNPIASSTLGQSLSGNKQAQQTYKAETGIDLSPKPSTQTKTNNSKTRNQQNIEDINKLSDYNPVKWYAKGANWLVEGNPLGRFISQALPHDPSITDSTGNKTADKIANFTSQYVTAPLLPTGAPLGEGIIGSTYGAAGRALNTNSGQNLVNSAARAIPKVSQPVAQNIARVGLTEGLAGAGQGVGFGLQNDQSSGSEIIRNAALGAGAGLALGAGGGALSGLFKRNGIPEAEINEILSLPLGRQDAAAARSATTPGTNPIVNPYTFGLPEASPGQLAREGNVASGRTELQNIDSVINDLNTRYEQRVIDEYKYLKDSRDNRGGVQQGNIVRDKNGDVIDRYGRQSNNPLWYQEFYGKNGRVPTNKDLYQLARDRVDNGFADESGQVPSWKSENNYDEQLAAYTEARNNLQSSVNELDPLQVNLTDTPLVTRKLRVNRSEEAPAPVLDDQTPGAGRNATERVQNQAVEYERGFASTLRASDKTPAEFANNLDSTYQPITNESTVNQANSRVNEDISKATSYVLSDSKFDAEKSVTAQRLIDHYNQQGNYQMSLNIADKVATEATKAGQFIQSLSIYDRLTPEGVLLKAKKLANEANAKLPKGAKEVKVTDKMAADLTQLAGVTQKMTGVKELSNDVIDILERAKSGEKISPQEAETLSKFVNESKQFIKDSTKKAKPPKAPSQPKDKRVREALTTFLDAQEEAAKERLRARGIRISSTPLDVWADYAVIGAAKMGKGIIKFADWSEEMVKDLGDDIRPVLSNLYDRSREAFELSSKKVTQQTISQAEKLTAKVIKNKQLEPAEADSLMQLAVNVSGLSGEAKRTASQDLQYILQRLDKPSLLRKISSVQTQAQLLNPKTQVRNIVGNELFYRLERLNKYVATPIDIARSKLTGSNRTVTFRTNNQGKFWENWLNGVRSGWKGVNINGLETQFDLTSPAFRGKYNPFTYTEKALGASLRGFDNAAYSRAVNKTLGEMATLDAINRGIKPDRQYVQKFIAKADDNIRSVADQYGKYVTFQDNNIFSQGLTRFKRGLNLITGSKDFGVGDLILKYPKTPGALLMRALEYSPAGFFRSAKIIAMPFIKREVEANPAEATLALSRAIIGTFGLSGMGYFLLDKGIITGDMSKDRDIRSLQQQAGQGQYQVNISALQRFVESGFDPRAATIKENDFLYNYDWLQPVSFAISMGANASKNIHDKNSIEKVGAGLAGTAINSLASGVNTLTEQSVLQGLQRAASGYPGQTVTDKIVDVVSDIPSSFIPTLVNQIRQVSDNTKRETYDPSKLQQALNTAQAKVPGLAGQLPVKYDTLGRPQQTYQDNNAFNVFLNPGYGNRYKLTPEAKLIVDLITETGDETLAPRVPGKTVQGNKLTGEQFSRLQQLQGEQTRDRLSKINPDASTKSKTKKVEKALNKAGEKARNQLAKEYELEKVKK